VLSDPTEFLSALAVASTGLAVQPAWVARLQQSDTALLLDLRRRVCYLLFLFVLFVLCSFRSISCF
jgi:hypothetical protein